MSWSLGVHFLASAAQKAQNILAEDGFPEGKTLNETVMWKKATSCTQKGFGAVIASCASHLFPNIVLVPCTTHISCQLSQLCDALQQSDAQYPYMQVLLIFCNVDDNAPLDVPNNVMHMPHIFLTVLSISKSRFPAFPLSQVTELFSAVDHWYQRPLQKNCHRLIFFVGNEGPSKALFLALAYRAWELPQIHIDEQIDECFARLAVQYTHRASADKDCILQGGSELIDRSLVPRLTPQALFASQFRMLRCWHHLCRSTLENVKSSFIPRRMCQIKLSLWVNVVPLLEIWTSDQTVFTTDLWATKTYQARHKAPLTTIPLRYATDALEMGGWVINLQNGPRLTGDVLIRFLPSSPNAGAQPEWMYRIQLHVVMLPPCDDGNVTMSFVDADIDGFDLNTLKGAAVDQSLRVTIQFIAASSSPTQELCLSVEDLKKVLGDSLALRQQITP